jgi:hypothetical protein
VNITTQEYISGVELHGMDIARDIEIQVCKLVFDICNSTAQGGLVNA